jgi:hypothetical protein
MTVLARLASIALLVLQPVVFFRHVLINPKHHIPWDLYGFHVPLLTFQARELREGRFPLWNPLVYCGFPAVADVQAQTFYPPNWILWGLRNASSQPLEGYLLQWFDVAHMMLAGLLLYWLLRRMGCARAVSLFGGTCFQLSAFFATQAQHVGAVCAAAWLPLCWLGVYELRRGFSRRWILALVLGLAMAFLSGFVAVTYAVYAAVVLFAMGLWAIGEGNRWMLPRVALAFGAAVGVVSVQLLPTMELTGLSVAQFRADWADGGGIPVNAWKSIFWPDALHVFEPEKVTEPYNYTFLYLYNGWAPLALALGALAWPGRRTRLAGGLALVLLLLSFGSHVPGLAALMRAMPRGVQSGWYPEFFVAAFCGAMALAAALMLERLPGRRWKWAAAGALAAELVLVGSRRPMNTGEGSWRLQGHERAIGNAPGLVEYLQAELHQQFPPRRIDSMDVLADFSMAAPVRTLPASGGDSPFAPLRVLALRRQFAGGQPWERNLPVTDVASPWLDFLNVGVLAAWQQGVTEEQFREADWERRPQEFFVRLYRNQQPQERFFLVGEARWAAGSEAAWGRLAQLVKEPGGLRKAAVVEGAAVPVSAPGQVRVVQYASNRVELETRSAGPSLLVSSETDYPGWRATVDGQPAAIRTANYAYRGLVVPAGSHTVVMEFRPPILWWGAMGTAATLLALGFWMRRLKPEAETAPDAAGGAGRVEG